MDNACICRTNAGRRWINTECREHGVPSAAAEPLTEIERLRQRQDPATLTARERQILGLLAEGLSNPAIGKRLWVTEDTVKTHARRMFAKLGAQNRAHAVAIGYQRRLLTVPPPDLTDLAGLAARENASLPAVTLAEPTCQAVVIPDTAEKHLASYLSGWLWSYTKSHHQPREHFSQMADVLAKSVLEDVVARWRAPSGGPERGRPPVR